MDRKLRVAFEAIAEDSRGAKVEEALGLPDAPNLLARDEQRDAAPAERMGARARDR